MWTLSNTDILEATGGRLLFGELNGTSGISIDSRTIKKGELFVALKGARFDGHDFLAEALNEGSGAIVSLPPTAPPKGKAIIYVENTLRALQDIARFLRVNRGVPVVGITGSNGKSTTKEMTAAVLGTRYKVLKNTGNLNNQIGLPLSLLGLAEDDEVAVLEMGASAPGDIKELCEVAVPDYGVITNIAHAHLEGFKDIESIRSTKLEILPFVKAVAVNAEDAFLMDGIKGYGGKVLTYGLSMACDICAEEVVLGERESTFRLKACDSSIDVSLRVTGRVNVMNALGAAAVGKMLGIELESIKQGLESFVGIPMRLEIRDYDGATVISDVYNANPASMEEALKELVRLRKNRAVAVLGDMLELGYYAETAHRKLGSWMSEFPIDLFIAVGPMMGKAAEEFTGQGGASVLAADSKEAREILREKYNEGDTILIKGSRGMKMEMVLNGNGG